MKIWHGHWTTWRFAFYSPRFVKRARFFRFFPEPFPYFPNISQHFQSVLIIVIFSFHSRSRSRPFPGIIASDSRSRILGTFFFIPFPFPNFGNAFFHSLPVPEFWEWIFSFPSRSRILGMEFSIPFPFPNFGNGIFYSRSRSRTLKSHSRSPLAHIFLIATLLNLTTTNILHQLTHACITKISTNSQH